MKLFAVSFIGLNPVGAVALVKAESAFDARFAFMDYIREHRKDLAAKNSPSDLKIRELNSFPGVEILLDGDY